MNKYCKILNNFLSLKANRYKFYHKSQKLMFAMSKNSGKAKESNNQLKMYSMGGSAAAADISHFNFTSM